MNGSYHYSVVIPKMLVGYDGDNPLQQPGFVILLGGQGQARIHVFAQANSFEATSAVDAANRLPSFLNEEGKVVIQSTLIEGKRLGKLPAIQVEMTYKCKDAPTSYVEVDTLALSPSKDLIYDVALLSPAGELTDFRLVFEQVLSTWHYLEQRVLRSKPA